MDIAELDMASSAELLPDRQALCCWRWSPCGGHEYYSYTSFSFNLSVNYTQVTSYSW